MNNFVEKNSFQEIHSHALAQLGESKNQLNFTLQTAFPIEIVKKPELLDVSVDAEDFQNVELPKHLHINHGMYIKENGIQNLINELQNKENSNRAIISLIDQDDIVGTGDEPIPSFMIIQAAIENNILYLTTYFRALEVSSFLRINLEEIRMILEKIYSKFHKIETVKLHIFAFKAYIKEGVTLKRAAIELLKQYQLIPYLENPKRLIPLLEEKIQTYKTVIDDQSFYYIKEILEDNKSNTRIDTRLKGIYTINIIKKIIDTSENIKKLRTETSHSVKIEELYSEYLDEVRKLIYEIAKIS